MAKRQSQQSTPTKNNNITTIPTSKSKKPSKSTRSQSSNTSITTAKNTNISALQPSASKPTTSKSTTSKSTTSKSSSSKEKKWQLPEMLQSHIDPLFRHRIYTTLEAISDATYSERMETHLAITCNFQSDLYRDEATRLLYALSRNESLVQQYDPIKIISIPDSMLIEQDPHKLFQQKRHMRRQQFDDMITKLTADADQTSLRCRKCHQQIDVNSAQTRGADEPMTIFYNCLNPDCLHQGKM